MCSPTAHLLVLLLSIHLGVSTVGSLGCADGTVEVSYVPNRVVGCDVVVGGGMLQQSINNACHPAWKVCKDLNETSLLGLTKQLCDSTPRGKFYATQQASNDGRACHGQGENGVFGCGTVSNITVAAAHSCDPLTSATQDWALGIANGWYTSTSCWSFPLNITPNARALSHIRSNGACGGVLCCWNGSSAPTATPTRVPTQAPSPSAVTCADVVSFNDGRRVRTGLNMRPFSFHGQITWLGAISGFFSCMNVAGGGVQIATSDPTVPLMALTTFSASAYNSPATAADITELCRQGGYRTATFGTASPATGWLPLSWNGQSWVSSGPTTSITNIRCTELLTVSPTVAPTVGPSVTPSTFPTQAPSATPSIIPTNLPTNVPTFSPSTLPTMTPTQLPSLLPSASPISVPTKQLCDAFVRVTNLPPDFSACATNSHACANKKYISCNSAGEILGVSIVGLNLGGTFNAEALPNTVTFVNLSSNNFSGDIKFTNRYPQNLVQYDVSRNRLRSVSEFNTTTRCRLEHINLSHNDLITTILVNSCVNKTINLNIKDNPNATVVAGAQSSVVYEQSYTCACSVGTHKVTCGTRMPCQQACNNVCPPRWFLPVIILIFVPVGACCIFGCCYAGYCRLSNCSGSRWDGSVNVGCNLGTWVSGSMFLVGSLNQNAWESLVSISIILGCLLLINFCVTLSIALKNDNDSVWFWILACFAGTLDVWTALGRNHEDLPLILQNSCVVLAISVLILILSILLVVVPCVLSGCTADIFSIVSVVFGCLVVAVGIVFCLKATCEACVQLRRHIHVGIEPEVDAVAIVDQLEECQEVELESVETENDDPSDEMRQDSETKPQLEEE